MRRARHPRLPSGPIDPGMQEERTLLAWERTGLAVVAAAAGVSRHAFGQLGFAFLLPCAVAAVGGLWVYMSALRRGRLAHSPSCEPIFTSVLRDGRLVALVAGLMALLCLGEAFAAARGLAPDSISALIRDAVGT